MGNERLRVVLTKQGMTYAKLASAVGVDPKTVERWVSTGRTPHRTIADRAAKILEADVVYLWPTFSAKRRARGVDTELISMYTRRSDLPINFWHDHFSKATNRIDILVYAAIFLHEQNPDLIGMFRDKAQAGCTIRVLLGAAESEQVKLRGDEERFGHGIDSRCRLALMHHEPLKAVPGVSVHLHRTTLYNSLYRVDDELLVNTHVYGANAYAAPCLHLRRVSDGGMFDGYVDSFETVWETSAPAWEV